MQNTDSEVFLFINRKSRANKRLKEDLLVRNFTIFISIIPDKSLKDRKIPRVPPNTENDSNKVNFLGISFVISMNFLTI